MLGLVLPVSLQAGQISLMDALEQTLSRHPQIKISEQLVEGGRALRQQALGPFDTVLQGNVLQTHQHDPILTGTLNGLESRSSDITTAGATATRLLGNGVSLESQLDVNRTAEYLLPTGLNTTQLAFQVRLPLLRGRGRAAVESELNAAGLEVDARLYELNQTISDLLAVAASSYWQYVAAMRILDVFRESEDRGKIYMENVQTLIEASRIPRNDIYQVRANLGARAANRAAAEQNVIEARQQLALSMGLSATELESLGDPADNLPAGMPASGLNREKYVNQAIARRGDLRASRTREDAGRVLIEGRKNQIKPQVDLVFRTGYSGLREGTGPADLLSSPFRGVQGADVVAGISYQFPRGNHEALGRLAESQANLRITELRTADLTRQIASNTIAALGAVENAAARVREIERSVADFQAALSGEREKYQLGRSSLIDVLTLEDRLTSAASSRVDAELAYAIALVRLRQATSTIIKPDEQVHTIDRTIFFNLPSETQ